MKLTAMTLMAALTGVAARAAKRNVTVCMEAAGQPLRKSKARALTSKMFACIGNTIDWRLGLRGCRPPAILISLSNNAPATLCPGTLAYARPYEDAHTRLFYLGSPYITHRPCCRWCWLTCSCMRPRTCSRHQPAFRLWGNERPVGREGFREDALGAAPGRR